MENLSNAVTEVTSLVQIGLNISDNVTISPTRPRMVVDPCERGLMVQRFITDVIVSMPIACLGILGNIVSFIVLCRQKQRLTTTVLLQGLAVMDTLILLSTILLRSLRYMHICVGGLDLYYQNFHYVFRWLYPFVYFFRQAQTWLITLLTIDRWIAVCRPLHAQRLCTLSVAYKQMAAVLVGAFLVSLPRFFEYRLNGDNKFGFELTDLSKNQTYTIAYKIILFFIIMYLIPMVTLTVLNSQLLCTLRQASIYRASMQQNRSMSSKASGGRSNNANSNSNRNHRSVTIIVCVVVLLCILCNLFTMTSHLLWSLAECFSHLKYLEDYRRYVVRGSNVLVTISSAINFFIYCVCSRNFRSVLIRTFLCRRQCALRGLKNTRHSTLTNSSHTSLTYMPVNNMRGSAKLNLIALEKQQFSNSRL